MGVFAIYRGKKMGMAEMLLGAEHDDHMVFEAEEGILEEEPDAEPAAGPAAEPSAEASSVHLKWVRPMFRFGQ